MAAEAEDWGLVGGVVGCGGWASRVQRATLWDLDSRRASTVLLRVVSYWSVCRGAGYTGTRRRWVRTLYMVNALRLYSAFLAPLQHPKVLSLLGLAPIYAKLLVKLASEKHVIEGRSESVFQHWRISGKIIQWSSTLKLNPHKSAPRLIDRGLMLSYYAANCKSSTYSTLTYWVQAETLWIVFIGLHSA